jgi:hypothetical protein
VLVRDTDEEFECGAEEVSTVELVCLDAAEGLPSPRGVPFNAETGMSPQRLL